MARTSSRTAALAVALSGLALACGGAGENGEASGAGADRREAVAERGAGVMGFDLDATTHRFAPADDGLVQTVVADDPADAEQVALVREHLAHEAERFGAGDYTDPAAIHGDAMPGLTELTAGAERITVAYEPVDAGGRITYTTADPALVTALHRWAEAQLADHGTHAEPG
jgi:hypothetical protein